MVESLKGSQAIDDINYQAIPNRPIRLTQTQMNNSSPRVLQICIYLFVAILYSHSFNHIILMPFSLSDNKK